MITIQFIETFETKDKALKFIMKNINQPNINKVRLIQTQGMKMQIFKRSPTEDGIKDTWSPVKGLDGKIHPNIIDSNGDYFGLETHRISSDGNVSTSVVCPYGCGFHEFIKLDGWEEITEEKQE